jgi:hypothetical protein
MSGPWFVSIGRRFNFVEIHARFRAQYGVNALLRWSAYEWLDVLKEGRITLTNSECYRRPFIATTAAKWEQVRAMFLKKTNKCKVFQRVTKRTETSHSHRTTRKFIGNISHLAR